MEYDFDKEVKLYMIFDILGDTQRSGPLLWKIDRQRLEDVKDHVADLIFIVRILKKHFPNFLDFDSIYDYIICHDIPEAITGDITKFEGVSGEEINRVTQSATIYLSKIFNGVIDFEKIINGFENRIDIEAKVVHMLDKLHSSITFIKYQSEQDIDMNNPNIIRDLRNNPFVIKKITEGKDLADIFFEFHSMAIYINDEECIKYNISRVDADVIVDVIKAFANELYNKKISGSLLVDNKLFPKDATIYNKRLNIK